MSDTEQVDRINSNIEYQESRIANFINICCNIIKYGNKKQIQILRKICITVSLSIGYQMIIFYRFEQTPVQDERRNAG